MPPCWASGRQGPQDMVLTLRKQGEEMCRWLTRVPCMNLHCTILSEGLRVQGEQSHQQGKRDRIILKLGFRGWIKHHPIKKRGRGKRKEPEERRRGAHRQRREWMETAWLGKVPWLGVPAFRASGWWGLLYPICNALKTVGRSEDL